MMRKERLRNYIELMRLHRPIGILLLLWPTLWSLWIAARGIPDWNVLLVFIAGVVLMRSAGCVINDYADRNFDRHVERTADRPLTAGRVTPLAALLLFGVLCLMALALVLTLNELTIWLSLGGVVLAILYPFMKRVTHLPQVFLGAAFGWAVPMAFAAQSNSLPALAWLIFTATVLWATVYDTMYAMVDRQDDIALGLKSTAILFGEADRLIIGLLQIMVLICLVMIGRQADLGLIYFANLALAAAFFGYQQYLIRYRERNGCFRAFLNNNWFGLIVFVGIALDLRFG